MPINEFETDTAAVQIVDERTAQQLIGVSPRTWDRLRAVGDLPAKTRLSTRRVGYRIADIKTWLDARREPQPAA